MTEKVGRSEISFQDKKIIFEGPITFVEMMVKRYTNASKPQAKNIGNRNLSESEIESRGVSERELVAAKRPRGHHEIVAVLAFALTEAGVREFSEDDIRKAYIRANVRPPKIVGQALRDAKNKFEYVEPAGQRGQYRLTNHGERVVRFDLPRPGSEKK